RFPLHQSTGMPLPCSSFHHCQKAFGQLLHHLYLCGVGYTGYWLLRLHCFLYNWPSQLPCQSCAFPSSLIHFSTSAIRVLICGVWRVMFLFVIFLLPSWIPEPFVSFALNR